MINISQISFNPNHVLGRGSTSIVYSGKIQNRDVAVKQVPKSQNLLIEREIELLIKSDSHKNIVRYFMVTEDKLYRYIALELCQFTVLDYVKQLNIQNCLPQKDLIWKIFQGLKRLHEIGIVHRDIKPSNILLLQMSPCVFEAKISDFGFSKDLGHSSSQMSVTPNGSNIFTPPEMQLGKFNAKSDVYMLGGLVYYIYKNSNISSNAAFQWKSDIDEKSDDCLIKNMIQQMCREPLEQRPSMYCISFHPYFWNYQKILDFLVDISNRLEKRDQGAYAAVDLFQQDCSPVIKSNWLNVLDDAVRQTLPHRNRMNYDGHSVEHLIRALRNKKNHYDDMSKMAKQILGPIPDGFTSYWINMFPKLLIHVYLKWHSSGLYAEENFKQFYPDSKCY